METLLDYALQYAKLGWKIFPLKPGEKAPITRHGVKDATSEEAQIVDWWSRWPKANIGLACGAASGVYAIDIDFDTEKGINGYESIEKLGPPPGTVQQNTPRGGAHLFYGLADGQSAPANKNGLRPGVDIRGDGYYVVLSPSVHPNGGVYQWAPGCTPWDLAPAVYPDFMRVDPVRDNISRGNGVAVSVQTSKTIQPNNYRPDDRLARARLYFEHVEPAVDGQGGHNKLLWAAQCAVNGLKMTDEEAYAFLAAEYNPRCVPPWDLSEAKDEGQFRHKIKEARAKPTARHPYGWIIDDPAYAVQDVSACSVNVKSLLNKPSKTNDLIQNAPDGWSGDNEAEMDFLCKPVGLVGEICAWINSTSRKPQPFLTLACVLAFMGTLVGRKVRDKGGSRTNIYCMGVAPSSAGKAHAPNQIRRLADLAGCINLIGGDDIASDSAIEERMSKEPATLFLLDEIGHLLAHIKSGVDKNNAKIVALLMKLFSSAGNIYLGKEFSDSERQRTITQPCLSIYGTSTPDRFASGLSPQELKDGWLSRCLIFRSTLDLPKRRDIDPEQPPPEELVQKVRHWAQRQIESGDPLKLSTHVTPSFKQSPPSQIVARTTNEAEQVFVEFDKLSERMGCRGVEAAVLWAKAEENARRIALVVASGNSLDDIVITRDIADFACRLIRYILRDFILHVVPEIVTNEYENGKRKVYSAIKEAGFAGIIKRDLTRKIQWATKALKDAMLSDLIEAEMIVSSRAPGTNQTMYFTHEAFQSVTGKIDE